MKNKTKFIIITTIGIALTAILNSKSRIEHSINHQITKKRLKKQSIYGTWLHKSSLNPFIHRYRGGINVKDGSQLLQYRFTTNAMGKINKIKLINRQPQFFMEK